MRKMELRGPKTPIQEPHERRFIRVRRRVHVTGSRRPPRSDVKIAMHANLAQDDNIVGAINAGRNSADIDAGFIIIDPGGKKIVLYGVSVGLRVPQPEWHEEARAQTIARVREIFPGFAVTAEK